MDGRARAACIIILVGGVLAVAAAFLPWTSLSLSVDEFEFGQGFDFSDSITGLNGGDGWITLVAGVLLLPCGIVPLAGLRRGVIGWAITGLVISLGILAVALINIVSPEGEVFGAELSTEIGLWLTLLAGLATVGATILLITRTGALKREAAAKEAAYLSRPYTPPGQPGAYQPPPGAAQYPYGPPPGQPQYGPPPGQSPYWPPPGQPQYGPPPGQPQYAPPPGQSPYAPPPGQPPYGDTRQAPPQPDPGQQGAQPQDSRYEPNRQDRQDPPPR